MDENTLLMLYALVGLIIVQVGLWLFRDEIQDPYEDIGAKLFLIAVLWPLVLMGAIILLIMVAAEKGFTKLATTKVF